MSSGTNKPTPASIVYFGNERLVSGLEHTPAPILSALIDEGHSVKAVISNDASTKSRKTRPLEVAELAKTHKIPVFLPDKPMDIYDELQQMQADIGVLAAYGRIVPKKIIDLFPHGIVNIHPSLLPKYRGPSPIETAILNGDTSTGVSLMQLSPKMDAGAIYHQVEFHLPKYETAPHLGLKLASLGATELIAALNEIIDGTLKPEDQDESAATYTQRISKADARLDPKTQTADEAERKVRAYLAFPRARLQVAGHDLIILKARTARQAKTPLDTAFKDGKYLVIEFLVAPSGKTMSAEAFVTGYLKK
jgi:methionyl-tRNA formyltransferase